MADRSAAYDHRMRRLLPITLLVVTLLIAACSDDPDGSSGLADGTSNDTDSNDTDSNDTAGQEDGASSDDESSVMTATFDVRASAGQVTIMGATPEIDAELTNGTDTYSGVVDELGNLIFRLVEPGDGYVVTTFSAPDETSDTFSVPTLDDHPDPDFYAAQTLEEGLNYIEMRDGTLLSAMVRFPEASGDGPFPTVVEYSGYDPSSPVEEEPTIGIYRALGYATVGVNMRGSGCSGGAFDYFEPIQSIDGYDMIEAIARQDWVEHNHVGMVGISYSGISQLYVAATQPPSLAAITCSPG